MTDITGFKRDVVSSYIPKDPGATLTYTIDWTNYLRTGASLATSSFAISTIAGDSSALSNSADGIVGAEDQTYVKLTAGSAGNVYTVTNTITTDNGDTDVRRFRVKVEQRYL